MQKILSGWFFILFSGLVVAFCFIDSVFASAPVPNQISSHKARTVRVYLKTQRFGYYERGRLVFWGPICSGRPGRETPKGRFRVLRIEKIHKSTEHKGAIMPFSVQFTAGPKVGGKGGHFLHEGILESRPSSGGCVRLGREDAIRVFHSVRLEDPVIVTD